MTRPLIFAVAALVGCGSTPLGDGALANKMPACHLDFQAPGEEHTDNCGLARGPVFDIKATIGGKRLETNFFTFGQPAVTGYDLSWEGVLSYDGQLCTLGALDVDALPPHWVVSLYAQCGPVGIRGVLYAD